jgi:hypothetical protein
MKQAVQGKKKSDCSGQAMLIAVLSLGGAILGATTVAGLLTLYQIRATTDTANSARAIFAADAGTEWALFNHYCAAANPERCGSAQVASGTQDIAPPTFSASNGDTPTLTVNCYSNYAATGATTTCSSPSTVAAISSGIANSSERAFFIGLSSATTTYP